MLGLMGLVMLAVGCVRGCPSSRPPVHVVPNMDYQEKAEAQEESRFFYDGMVMRQPVPGTVARGQLVEDPAFHSGRDAAGEFLASNPLPITAALLARGAERYSIYCQPCHDARGSGRGIVYEWGGVPTATFHDEQRRGYPDGQLFDVITNGSGLMRGYRWPISPGDRWAIVSHVRWLQQEKQARDELLAGRR